MRREYDTRNVHFTGEMVGQWLNELLTETISRGEKEYELRYWDPFDGWVSIKGEIKEVQTIPIREY